MKVGKLPLASIGIISLFACDHSRQDDKPNFIIIQADDLGWDDIAFHGNTYVHSDCIDDLAAKSIRFSNFYVNPVCAPTRASLLTGRHFLKTGVSHVHGGKEFINPEEHTLAEILKTGGYVCGLWGKWHSGTGEGYYPWQRGFDEAYMARLYKHNNSVGLLNGEFVQHTEWADKVICDYALDFMKRNSSKPFLAYLSFLSIHAPLDAPKDIIQKYKNKGLSEGLSKVYAMVDHFDSNLDIFLREAEESGLLDNTVILFMSDNGPAVLNNDLNDKDRQIRYVNKLTGHKGNIWENGVKSPLFVYQKGKYENRENEYLSDITDILPSLMEIAGIDLPQGFLPLDGKSFLPELCGKKPVEEKCSYNYANPGWPPTDLPWTPEGVKDEYRPLSPEMISGLVGEDQIISVRKGDYKLLCNPASYPGTPETDSILLVNIEKDPGESVSLNTKYPEIYSELKTSLFSWFEEIKKSPHSFSSPVIKIPAEGGIVPAKTAFLISNENRKSYNTLIMDGENNWAEFYIEPAYAGYYNTKLEFIVPPLSKQKISIQVDGRIFDVQQSGNFSTDSVFLPAGKLKLRLECDKIDAGRIEIDNVVFIPVE